MKMRTLFLIISALAATAVGVVKVKHTLSSASSKIAKESDAKELVVDKIEPQVQPPASAAMANSSLTALKGVMSRLSDEELNQQVIHSSDEIRKGLAADPTGTHRSDADTKRIALELDREAAARLLLIDRKLDSIRRKVL